MLWYVPLEPLRERYTSQLSAPTYGWYERKWIEHRIPYRRIDGILTGQSYVNPKGIAVGQVLDAPNRCRLTFAQTDEILRLAEKGDLTNNHVIYFDDFWHPGIEALGYCFAQMNLHPKMYAYCWAQSVDEFDFTFPMRHWMQHYERGNMTLLEGVFVANTLLKDLLISCREFDSSRVHVVGLPFCTEEVMERMPGWYSAKMAIGNRHAPLAPRENKIIFSSRWDNEKNPKFFLDVAAELLEQRKDVQFVICTSAPKLRSNDPVNLKRLHEAMGTYPNNIILKEGLSKEQYYEELCSAKVQMNTASQDWISFTLLEASVAGCFPIYPNYRSFPETFLNGDGFLYEHLNTTSALNKLNKVLDQPQEMWSSDCIRERSWVHKRFDSTWARQLKVMGLHEVKPEIEDPFNRQEVYSRFC